MLTIAIFLGCHLHSCKGSDNFLDNCGFADLDLDCGTVLSASSHVDLIELVGPEGRLPEVDRIALCFGQLFNPQRWVVRSSRCYSSIQFIKLDAQSEKNLEDLLDNALGLG